MALLSILCCYLVIALAGERADPLPGFLDSDNALLTAEQRKQGTFG